MKPARFFVPGSQPPVGSTPQSPGGPVQRKPSTKKKMPTNSPSQLLTLEENELVFNILGKGRQTLSTAVVQFMIPAEEFRKWKLQEVGVLCFVRDSGMKSYFLEIISLRMRRVIFSQEIYDEFGYRKPRSRFLTFEGDNFTIGLNFASEEEILAFQTVLDDKMAAKRERIAARQSRIFELQQLQHSPKLHPTEVAAVTPEQPRRTTSFDNRLDFGMPSNLTATSAPPVNEPVKQKPFSFKNNRRRRKSASKQKKKPLAKTDIGLPTDFRVVLHAGFDPDRGYVVDNYMDDKYSKLFHMAGVTDKELEDESTRDFILDFIEKYEPDEKSPVKAGGNYNTGQSNIPPPPTMITGGSSTNSRPPPVPARQIQPENHSAKKGPGMPFGNSPTLPTPSFQNKITITPIRANEIPQPPQQSPIKSSSGNGYIPPPPPFQSSKTAVAPPPPPPMPSSPARLPSVGEFAGENKSQPIEDERSALMRQIQERKKLKNVDMGERKPMGGLDYLDQIKIGVDLRKVSDIVKPSPDSLPMDGLAGALARALAERQAAINPDSSGSESDAGDVFDEDEWE